MCFLFYIWIKFKKICFQAGMLELSLSNRSLKIGNILDSPLSVFHSLLSFYIAIKYTHTHTHYTLYTHTHTHTHREIYTHICIHLFLLDLEKATYRSK